MAKYNPDFWEIPTDLTTLDRVAATDGLYYETELDKQRRYALTTFFEEVAPVVRNLIDDTLTQRQQEVLKLYYYYGKTQEDIAVILNLSQSTVSRHLYGTVRDGKKVGGALTKLRKIIEREQIPQVNRALDDLNEKMTEVAA